MSLATLALVLLSATLHATWNLWLKQLGHAGRSASLMWLLTAISSLLYFPIALFVFARGTWRPEPGMLIWVLGSGVIHVGYFLLLLRGYRGSDLSLVYPIARGTGPLLAAAGAVAVFAERPTAFSVIGALCVLAGVATLTLRPAILHDRGLGRGVAVGLAVGASIALYTLWDGWAVKRVGIPPFLYYAAGELVRVAFLTPAALADRAGVAEVWKKHRLRVAGIAALSPLSYVLILVAIRDGAIGHIAPAREVSIVIGAWLGGRVLGEGDRTRRLLAAGAFAAGVIALALA